MHNRTLGSFDMQAFTSVSLNYLPKARVLAETLKRQHPEAGFHLVLADYLPEWLAAAPAPFDSIIQVEQLPLANVKGWIFQHSLVELCTAVKGAAYRVLAERYPGEPLLYFDPDIVVLDRLEHLLAELRRADILLTPHLLEPEDSLDAVLDNEVCALKHGVYNLGFLGVAPTSEGRRFIHWWAERLNTLCYDEIERGLFTDQRWIDLAPAFFPTVGIIRDPGCNVATWNLTRRMVTGSLAEGLQANGRPLVFFHFSGFDNGAQKIMLDKFGGNNPVLYELRDWYVQQCRRTGQEELGQTPWAYNSFDNGKPITAGHRRTYRERLDVQRAFPNPTATGDVSHSYYHWYGQEQPPVPAAPRDELWRQLVEVREELARVLNSRSFRVVQRAAGLVRGRWFRRGAA
jgi:hypothetical protein